MAKIILSSQFSGSVMASVYSLCVDAVIMSALHVQYRYNYNV